MAFQGLKSLPRSQIFYEASVKAQLYAHHRHHTPLVVVNKILDFLNKTHKEPYGTALDVGSGSGQSAQILGQYFTNVIGIDSCNRNNTEAYRYKLFRNVVFQLGTAEELPYKKNNFHLVTASQAVHWFDTKLFFEEADRVLVPGGVLALYGYTTGYPVTGSENMKDSLHEYLNNFSNVYDSEKRLQAFNSLQDEQFKIPYEVKKSFDDIEFKRQVTGIKYKGYLQSSQGYRNYLLEHGLEAAEDILDQYISKVQRFLRIREDFDRAKFEVSYNYYLRMGQKPLEDNVS